MKITYDPEVDAIYIQFRDAEPARAVDIEDGVTADLDADGHIVGLEVLDATDRLGNRPLDSISLEVFTRPLPKSD